MSNHSDETARRLSAQGTQASPPWPARSHLPDSMAPPSFLPPPELPTPQINDHELVRPIGMGSYGVVWLCRSVLGTLRAVKVVYRKKFNDSRPFEREFNGIKRYEPISRSHPGLVAVLQIGLNEADGYFYYVMELADDMALGSAVDPERYRPKTLHAESARCHRLPVEEVVRLGVSLTSALGHLHQGGLLHRDVKPSNIIFVQGVPKLADIGLVTGVHEVESLVGTLGYMAPERRASTASDLFSLGMVLYEISTGKPNERFPELATHPLDSNDAVDFLRLNRIILRACAVEPSQRYQSAEEMRQALLHLRQAEPASGPSLQSPVPALPRAALLYKPDNALEGRLGSLLAAELPQHGLVVFEQRPELLGLAWAQYVEEQIRQADLIVVLLSQASVQSELLADALDLARSAPFRHNKRPHLVAIRVCYEGPLPEPLPGLLGTAQQLSWAEAGQDQDLVESVVQSLHTRRAGPDTAHRMEPPGGAVPLDSQYYVTRPTDHEFHHAIDRQDSIVLVKGPRQVGKTSLLARGLQHARVGGATVVRTDFQKLDANHLASADALFRKLGDFLADQLDLKVLPGDVWDSRRSPNTNFERYLRREVLGKLPGHFVWGMDEVDRLFACAFAGEVFGLLRSWHNERALEPTGPWTRLTLVIAYATEAYLFITDINQSPFNVGTRLALEDFTLEQVADLNRRYDSPLRPTEDLPVLFRLLGGQPYLVRLALNELRTGRSTFQNFLNQADREEGPFGDHLRRILLLLGRDPDLCAAVRAALRAQPLPDATSFYRLRSAGVLKGDSPRTAALRCELYARYLQRHLNS